MGRTIIQPIGPLYGEAVNGTVFGQPNGSIYVPKSNKIALTVQSALSYKIGVYSAWGSSAVCFLSSLDNPRYYDMVAESQDNASYMQMTVYSDAELETELFNVKQTAGLFGYRSSVIGYIAGAGELIEQGETYYARAELYSNSGVLIAVSDAVEVTGA